jgi:hypothetical protein
MRAHQDRGIGYARPPPQRSVDGVYHTSTLSSNAVFTLVGVAGNLANTLVRFHLLWSLTDVAAPALLSSARSLGLEPVEIEDEELLATPCVEVHSLSPTH